MIPYALVWLVYGLFTLGYIACNEAYDDTYRCYNHFYAPMYCTRNQPYAEDHPNAVLGNGEGNYFRRCVGVVELLSACMILSTLHVNSNPDGYQGEATLAAIGVMTTLSITVYACLTHSLVGHAGVPYARHKPGWCKLAFMLIWGIVVLALRCVAVSYDPGAVVFLWLFATLITLVMIVLFIQCDPSPVRPPTLTRARIHTHRRRARRRSSEHRIRATPHRPTVVEPAAARRSSYHPALSRSRVSRWPPYHTPRPGFSTTTTRHPLKSNRTHPPHPFRLELLDLTCTPPFLLPRLWLLLRRRGDSGDCVSGACFAHTCLRPCPGPRGFCCRVSRVDGGGSLWPCFGRARSTAARETNKRTTARDEWVAAAPLPARGVGLAPFLGTAHGGIAIAAYGSINLAAAAAAASF